MNDEANISDCLSDYVFWSSFITASPYTGTLHLNINKL